MRRWIGKVTWTAAAAAARGHKRRYFHQQTVQQALQGVRKRLTEAGLNGSDAKALIANALAPKLSSSNDVFLWSDHELRLDEAATLTEMVERRCLGEPLAYVLGVKEFWSMDFFVTNDTLIPRSDSEVLIEALVSLYPRNSELRILDLGTGSGCLLLAALSEYPNATGVGVDISAGALQVAQANADALGLANRSTFIEFDMEMLPQLSSRHHPQQDGGDLFQRFDVVLCNPPYIPLHEVPLIAPDVLAHEPHGALFSDGPNAWENHQVSRGNALTANQEDDLGLRFYIALCHSLDNLLDPKSIFRPSVLVEIGSERQANAVRELFNSSSSSSAVVPFDRFLMDAENRHRGLLMHSAK